MIAGSSAEGPPSAPYFLHSLERGLAVVQLFTRERPQLGLGEAEALTGMSRAAARRFLLTLADLSYVRPTGQGFRPTPGMLRLGYAYLSSHPFVGTAQVHLSGLAVEMRESASAWVSDRGEAVCVVHVPAARLMPAMIGVGTRAPASAAAAGRLLNSRRDWVISGDDVQPGIRTAAMAVRSPAGRRTGVIALSAHAARLSADGMRRGMLPALWDTAKRIESDLREGRPVPPPPGHLPGPRPGPLAVARSPDYVQTFGRGLAVIRAFTAQPATLSLSAVSEIARLPRAAARRCLLTLRDLGYVSAHDGLFELTPRVLDAGFGYLSSMSISEVAEPRLEELAARVGEAAAVAILDGPAVVIMARVAAAPVGAVPVGVGTRLPAWATAMGRVLLTQFPGDLLEGYLAKLELRPFTRHTLTSAAQLRGEIENGRLRGWVLADQELEEGLRALAVPVRNSAGEVAAAVAVTASAARTTADDLRRRVLPELRETADLIEEDLRSVTRSAAEPAVALSS